MKFLTQESDLLIQGFQIIYFYATWMSFYDNNFIILNSLQDRNCIAIDIDYFKSYCKRFNIISVPTTLILLNGQELKRIHGLLINNFNISINDICKSIGEKNAKKENYEKFK